MNPGQRVRWFTPHIGYQTGVIQSINTRVHTAWIKHDLPGRPNEWVSIHNLTRTSR